MRRYAHDVRLAGREPAQGMKTTFSRRANNGHRIALMSTEPQNVRGPIGSAPVRRARSVRRTSTIDMTWPGGLGTQLRLDGRARDIVTIDAGAPRVVGYGSVQVGI